MSGFEQLFPGKLPRLVMFDLDGTLAIRAGLRLRWITCDQVGAKACR